MFRDEDGVQRSTPQKLVAANEEVEAIVAVHKALADPAHTNFILRARPKTIPVRV